MDIERLMKIKGSSETPFNHDEYTIWLHNKIIDEINEELWNHRKSQQNMTKYANCNEIMNFKSLKRID